MTRSINQNADLAKSDRELADQALAVMQEAVAEAIDRKRRLGQYWVEWDGEKVVVVTPEDTPNPAYKKTA